MGALEAGAVALGAEGVDSVDVVVAEVAVASEEAGEGAEEAGRYTLHHFIAYVHMCPFRRSSGTCGCLEIASTWHDWPRKARLQKCKIGHATSSRKTH